MVWLMPQSGCRFFTGVKEKRRAASAASRVLGDDGYAAEPAGRYGLQRAAQERFAVHLGGQLVPAEAGCVAGGHDDAADTQFFHGKHLRGVTFSGSIPGKRKSCQEKRRYTPSRIMKSLFKFTGL